jgi:predicted AAA+ superfamily ATPase
LITGIQKFAKNTLRQKASSPKLSVLNTALMSAQSGKTFAKAREDRIFWGRLVESAVGAHLLNSIRGTEAEVFYWREGDSEVDFVLTAGDSVTAIEVKTSHGLIRRTGIDLFVSKFNPDRILLVGDQGIPLEKFLLMPLSALV